MAHEYRPGDVVRYDPAEHHCREGMAIAYERHGNVVLLDTFWDGYGDRHMLTADERDTAQLSFNLNDYDELDQYNRSSPGNWGKYAPDDRRTITSQHGLRKRWFIRQGATEHWPTQIDNARKEVATRESDVKSAHRRLEWALEDLARVIDAAREAGITLAEQSAE